MRFLALIGAVMMVFQAWTSGTVNGLSILGAALLITGALGIIRLELTNNDDR